MVACSRCGRVHERGLECIPRSKPNRNKRKPSNESKLRNKSAWAKKSRYIRGISYNLCAICREEGDYSFKPIEVHHIEPLKEVGGEGLLEDSNLIALCIYHHQKADRGDIPRSYLKELADRRDRREKEIPGGV